jgi:hypothetical protein
MGVRLKHFDWVAMQALINEGAGFNRCHAVFRIAHATWMKAIERGDIRVDMTGRPYADARKRFDWGAIQAYYDEGHSVEQCRRRFGFSNNTWHKAHLKGKVRTRKVRPLSIEQLAENPSNRGNIKRRLIDNGTLNYACALCGISDSPSGPPDRPRQRTET